MDIGVDTQRGQKVIHCRGRGIAPGKLCALSLLAVAHCGTEIQLNGTAQLKGCCQRHGASHGVHAEGEAHANAGGKAAAYGENLPLLFFGVIADLRFVKALQLQVEIRAGDIVGQGVGFVVPLGIIGSLGHLAQVPGPGHAHLQVLRQHIRTQRHAVLGIVHVLHLQRVVPGPNHGTEHGGIFAGGDDHFERGTFHRTAQIIQPSGQHLENVTVAHSAKVDSLHYTGGSHRRQNTGDAVILCHLGHSGQINDPEGHYFLLQQAAVQAQLRFHTHILAVGDPSRGGHGGLGEGQIVFHYRDG